MHRAEKSLKEYDHRLIDNAKKATNESKKLNHRLDEKFKFCENEMTAITNDLDKFKDYTTVRLGDCVLKQDF